MRSARSAQDWEILNAQIVVSRSLVLGDIEKHGLRAVAKEDDVAARAGGTPRR